MSILVITTLVKVESDAGMAITTLVRVDHDVQRGDYNDFGGDFVSTRELLRGIWGGMVGGGGLLQVREGRALPPNFDP